MLFMVIERFKNQDAKAIYRRLRDDARLFQAWVAAWSDLIEFELVPVVPSAETRLAIEPLL